jgi:hypothetical protein
VSCDRRHWGVDRLQGNPARGPKIVDRADQMDISYGRTTSREALSVAPGGRWSVRGLHPIVEDDLYRSLGRSRVGVCDGSESCVRACAADVGPHR